MNCVYCQQPSTDPKHPDLCADCYRGDTKGRVIALLDRINRLAEADMLKGNPVTGAHHRAIERVRAELGGKKL